MHPASGYEIGSGASGQPGAGSAKINGALPNDTSLLGLPLTLQWGVLDSGGPSGFGKVLSNSLRAVII